MLSPNVLPGLLYKRFAAIFTPMPFKDKMPTSFPIPQWSDQAGRYLEYWNWFTGVYLSKQIGTDEFNEPIYQWPLQINSFRTLARKLAQVLFGEVPDLATPLVRTMVLPKKNLDDTPPDEEISKQSVIVQNILDEIWDQSHGRSIQMEAGETSQILGGCVFQICHEPWRGDRFPIYFKYWPADFFLPIWDSDDYFNLQEAWLVYRIPLQEAKAHYNINITGQAGDAVYVEHWRRDFVTISINNSPVTMNFDGENITYDNYPNPFGFVPFVYIPRIREGNFYGSSFIPDIVGLVKEYNSRMADNGDAVHYAINRTRFVRNVQNAMPKDLNGEGLMAIDLGAEQFGSKNPPDAWLEDPPQVGSEIINFADTLWQAIMREASLSGAVFGEIEGTQRSALTIASLMWPVVSISRVQRTFWSPAMVALARMAIKILLMNPQYAKDAGVDIPANILSIVKIYAAWEAAIPRDRDALVNEMVLRKQSETVSTLDAIRAFGDARSPHEMLDNIRDDIEWRLQTEAKYAPTPASGSSVKGPKTKLNEPTASPGGDKADSPDV